MGATALVARHQAQKERGEAAKLMSPILAHKVKKGGCLASQNNDDYLQKF
jgi:hypothetical protein